MKFLAGFVFFTLVLSAQSMEVPRLDIAAGDQREASAIRIDHAWTFLLICCAGQEFMAASSN
jgi:hypothetical protein